MKVGNWIRAIAGVIDPTGLARDPDDVHVLPETEGQWLAWGDPVAMLRSRFAPKDPRRLRLFACACCRKVGDHLGDRQALVAVAERFADGRAAPDELREARRAAAVCRPGDAFGRSSGGLACLFDANARRGAAHAAEAVAEWARFRAGVEIQLERPGEYNSGQIEGVGERAVRDARRQLADLLRDIVGNPLFPARLDPAWLSPQVVAVARRIYGEHTFDDLPILADALEDVGCDDVAVVDHCRGPIGHARGCWVVDRILGNG